VKTGSASGNLRGILFMIGAMAAFTINDTFLKMATQTLPPFESVFLRAVFSLLLGLPMLMAFGGLGKLVGVAEWHVLGRSIVELIAVMGFVTGLANASIADMAALSQLAPIILMLIAGVFLKVRIERWQLGLAGLAFVGAVLVAQPGGAGFSPFALFGLWNAVAIAIRELLGRAVPQHISGLVVAYGSQVVVVVGIGVAMVLFEDIVMPGLFECGVLLLSAAFFMLAQFAVFNAYRMGEPGVIAPFTYTAAIWAVLSASLVFSAVPNALALLGIGLIVVSGVAVVVFGENGRRRKRRADVVDQPAN
jgi:drug/metabolite transporter (DMT)-like permease